MAENIWQDPIKAHEYYKNLVTKEQVAAVEAAESASIAADMVSGYYTQRACAIIDSMSPLGAAFVLAVLRTRIPADGKAGAIVKLAEILQIPAAEGLSRARDETYRRTGVLLP